MNATTISEAERLVSANAVDSHGFANAATVTIDTGVRYPRGLEPGMTGDEYSAVLADLCAAKDEAIAAAPARQAAAKRLLTDAGYIYSRERSRWERAGFFAVAHGYNSSALHIHVYADGAPVAMALTPSHPAESLGYGR